MKERRKKRSLSDMAMDAERADRVDGRVQCPRCGGTHFKTYGTKPGYQKIVRYKRCRHCDHPIRTSTPIVAETIIGEVKERKRKEQEPKEKQPGEESVVLDIAATVDDDGFDFDDPMLEILG